ncbi:MAG: HD domain-containing protein [Ignavibacteria bacterium]|nr:HD domain-containing protein [Ignavibacteria bacterium]
MSENSLPIELIYELDFEHHCAYGQDQEKDYEVLIEQCRSTIKDLDEQLIRKAYLYSLDAHRLTKRLSGDLYYTHPLKVALFLMTLISYGDNQSVAAAMLHDIVEDVSSISLQDIEKEFGAEIAQIVDGLTKISGKKTRREGRYATYTKLFTALVKDIRVILIKLADRYDNLRSLHLFTEKRQREVAEETLNFYVPFAQRLGLSKIRKQIEDFSLYYTNKEIYNSIKKALADKRRDFINFMKSFTSQIELKLNEKEINHIITIEHKHVYEIYRMLEQGSQISEIDNFYSLVIVLQSNDFAECYRAYGVIANIFGPVSTLEDYIARPKINFYRALHSTHISTERKLVEIIIRTEEMDKIADGGIAAVFSLKEGHKALELEEEDIEEWISWMNEIIQEGEEDAIQKIWGSIRMNLYEDDIIVHSKCGVSYRLPNGACPIDLAFLISDEKAYHCIAAKVNGETKALNYELKNNDYVEIISSPHSMPSEDWQNYVVSHKAVVKLYNYFKSNELKGINISRIDNSLPKFKVVAEDRHNVLNDIKNAFGVENISRINISSNNSIFEGVFTVSNKDENFLNLLFTKLFSVQGIKQVEKIEDYG